MTAAYQINHLKFRYGNERRGAVSPWVLNGLTFEVQAGEILGIIGPNGSGKTSLLKLLAQVLRPREGTIRLFGCEMSAMPQDVIALSVALVPQDTQVVFPFSITEVVLMGRFPHHQQAGLLGGFGWDGPEDLRLAEQAMRETDVLHLAARPIGDISGGERQRAIIARALAQEPKILLLDEPTAFLDLHHQLEIGVLLRRLNDERRLTVVLSSHDLNLASQCCDRLLLLDEGTVVRMGRPEEVIRPEVIEPVYHCRVLVDRHPESGMPRVTLPGRKPATSRQ